MRLLVPRLLELTDERSRRSLLHLLPRRAPDCEVGRDETDDLARAVLGCEPFEQSVRVPHIAHGERPDLGVGADTVPDEHAAGAAQRHEGGERSR